MHFLRERYATTNENAVEAKAEAPPIRVTRARAKALGTSTGLLQLSKPCFKQGQKGVLHSNAKRAAVDESKGAPAGTANLQHKKRAVLKDVTNILCENSNSNCVNAGRGKKCKQTKKGSDKALKNTSYRSVQLQIVQDDAKVELVEELSKITVADETTIRTKWGDVETTEPGMSLSVRHLGDMQLTLLSSDEHGAQLETIEEMDFEKAESPESPSIVDIDSKLKDPQACSVYAPDIYNKIHIFERERRPSITYMEELQGDITPIMRGILIDWLVEVSEEYKLVPDTLYLSVNLIDRFLSQKYIGKQRLQLVGVTCMLIASKYEEICAPRVDEFCFITDNTYTRGEVVKMESLVLNLLNFQISVPTIKTFLRRFIRAAQLSAEVPSPELEFLANYLAELTLLEYNFLKYLPSLVAASAVFLARWTLNQSANPWNPTLEHYTSYKMAELKATVLALEDLQLNTSGCSLHAIRDKYKQEKFKSVAMLASSEPVISLFDEIS